MRTSLLLLTATALVVHGKFVKIQNLHLKNVHEEAKGGAGGTSDWNSDPAIGNRTTMLRGVLSGGGGYTYDGDVAAAVGKAKLLHSVHGN